MKKYRVVKAYNREGLVIPVGITINYLASLKMTDVDRTALSLGALEEVKTWEPKEGDLVYLAYPPDGIKEYSYRVDLLHMIEWLMMGLLYPTREQAEECRRRMLETAKKYKEEVLGA